MPALTIITFGYDIGPAPEGAAWVADVRNIPGSVVDGIWQLNGNDKAVQDRVLATEQAKRWLTRFSNDILPTLKPGDMIAVGCSIGVHRSGARAHGFATIARDDGWDVTIRNRDLGKRDTGRSMNTMTQGYEVRAVGENSITFATVDGKPAIDARAIKYDSWSVDLGGFRERMMPGSVTLDADMVALFDHDTSKVLGRTSAGTMEIRSDSQGFGFTAFPPDTTWANDLRVSMTRGDIKGCSFRMMVEKDAWYVDNGQVCRDVLAARVSEFTVTSMPAYPETSAEARDHAASLAAETAIPDNLEERAGRVLSDANEQALKQAYTALEQASNTIGQVLAQVDATFDPTVVDDTIDSEAQVSEILDGASGITREASGGAPEKKAGTFVPGFGFINPKGK